MTRPATRDGHASHAAHSIDEPLTIARPSATDKHVLELWASALREVCDGADATPQDLVRARAALRELRSYARLDS